MIPVFLTEDSWDSSYCSESTWRTLFAFYRVMRGDSWYYKGNWCLEPDLKKWHGISINIDRNVTKLELPSNNLNGVILDEIAHLHSLVCLNFSVNNLTGNLNQALCSSLSSLIILDLSHNNVSGVIPREIKGLELLEVLRLQNNKFCGLIPHEIGLQLTRLRHVNLTANKLDGHIPSCLQRLTHLDVLRIHDNSFDQPESLLLPLTLQKLMKDSFPDINLFYRPIYELSPSNNDDDDLCPCCSWQFVIVTNQDGLIMYEGSIRNGRCNGFGIGYTKSSDLTGESREIGLWIDGVIGKRSKCLSGFFNKNVSQILKSSTSSSRTSVSMRSSVEGFFGVGQTPIYRYSTSSTSSSSTASSSSSSGGDVCQAMVIKLGRKMMESLLEKLNDDDCHDIDVSASSTTTSSTARRVNCLVPRLLAVECVNSNDTRYAMTNDEDDITKSEWIQQSSSGDNRTPGSIPHNNNDADYFMPAFFLQNELLPCGYRPIHFAAAYGDVDLVGRMLAKEFQACCDVSTAELEIGSLDDRLSSSSSESDPTLNFFRFTKREQDEPTSANSVIASCSLPNPLAHLLLFHCKSDADADVMCALAKRHSYLFNVRDKSGRTVVDALRSERNFGFLQKLYNRGIDWILYCPRSAISVHVLGNSASGKSSMIRALELSFTNKRSSTLSQHIGPLSSDECILEEDDEIKTSDFHVTTITIPQVSDEVRNYDYEGGTESSVELRIIDYGSDLRSLFRLSGGLILNSSYSFCIIVIVISLNDECGEKSLGYWMRFVNSIADTTKIRLVIVLSNYSGTLSSSNQLMVSRCQSLADDWFSSHPSASRPSNSNDQNDSGIILTDCTSLKDIKKLRSKIQSIIVDAYSLGFMKIPLIASRLGDDVIRLRSEVKFIDIDQLHLYCNQRLMIQSIWSVNDCLAALTILHQQNDVFVADSTINGRPCHVIALEAKHVFCRLGQSSQMVASEEIPSRKGLFTKFSSSSKTTTKLQKLEHFPHKLENCLFAARNFQRCQFLDEFMPVLNRFQSRIWDRFHNHAIGRRFQFLFDASQQFIIPTYFISEINARLFESVLSWWSNDVNKNEQAYPSSSRNPVPILANIFRNGMQMILRDRGDESNRVVPFDLSVVIECMLVASNGTSDNSATANSSYSWYLSDSLTWMDVTVGVTDESFLPSFADVDDDDNESRSIPHRQYAVELMHYLRQVCFGEGLKLKAFPTSSFDLSIGIVEELCLNPKQLLKSDYIEDCRLNSQVTIVSRDVRVCT